MGDFSRLWLVQGGYRLTYYGTDKSENFNAMRLVEADSEGEAKELFIKHYDSMTDAYRVYYHAYALSAEGVIK
jgi:hypothetical protein